jgi:hypothetical protein
MADVVVEVLPVDDWLALSKWMCRFDVSMGAGERPRRGLPSCWSAMTAKCWRLSYFHARRWWNNSVVLRGALASMWSDFLDVEVNKGSPEVMSGRVRPQGIQTARGETLLSRVRVAFHVPFFLGGRM